MADNGNNGGLKKGKKRTAGSGLGRNAKRARPTANALPTTPDGWTADDIVLVFGGSTGWIGQKVMGMLADAGVQAVAAASRLENREEILAEIEAVKPTRIINAAGVTGVPNIDALEDNKEMVIRSNIIGTLNVCDCAWLSGLHCTIFATGCIYEYDEAHPMYSGIGFTEDDPPNFSGSYYSLTKGLMERMLRDFNNALILRLRMPISDDLNPRSLVTKITKYEYVIDIPNSMSVLADLLPVSLDMVAKSTTGVFNFTNPGAISHNEVLTLFRDIVRPEFTWKNFTLEEQDKVLKAARSNNELDTTKLISLYPDVPEIHEAVAACFRRMKAAMDAE